ncbi:RmlC-like cupin domain-containing protein [Chaetomium strumarium]|uniref:RmlC-like cupin domain-containing protein n=1 Tax=Chaetomium strumarium TaxID=1170767 RepID=A0AAJ0GTL6_9PEZI|nr:RmlC-like cupin domain-containing protein [Chaetomium strumarium]
MASLLPLIQDILPMILPASVAVTKAADILPAQTQPAESESQREGEASGLRVICRNALVDKADKMCASVLVVKPNSSSSVRHHGEQEAILYTVSGNGALLTQPEGDDEKPKRHEIGPGDFAFIPAWTEHQVVNESGVDFHLVVIRSGSKPVEVSLTDWGGPQTREEPQKPMTV